MIDRLRDEFTKIDMIRADMRSQVDASAAVVIEISNSDRDLCHRDGVLPHQALVFGTLVQHSGITRLVWLCLKRCENGVSSPTDGGRFGSYWRQSAGRIAAGMDRDRMVGSVRMNGFIDSSGARPWPCH